MDGIDLTLLRIMRFREKLDNMYAALPFAALDEKTKIILEDFRVYFAEFHGHAVLEPDTFRSWFFAFRHPTLTGENKEFYSRLLAKLHEPVDEATEKGIVARILELDFATRAANILKKYEGGDELDVAKALREAVEMHEAQLDRKVAMPWVKDSIIDLLDEDQRQDGLSWPLSCINGSMRPLREGDFGIIAARPDVGKTSFIAHVATYMAPQLAEGKHIYWFNNEGPGKRIVTRLYQAALNATITDLLTRRAAGTIVDDYIKAVGMIDRIKVLDIHDCWNYDVTDMLKDMQPGLVIFDMIDNIKFGGQMANNGSRTDQALEAMYQWARIRGVKSNTPVLATSQISADGDGMQFPLQHMLKDSKTGKQGAADFILTLGMIHEPGMEHSRFIGLNKNKLCIEGGPKDPRAEVLFNGLTSRFIEPQSQGGVVDG